MWRKHGYRIMGYGLIHNEYIPLIIQTTNDRQAEISNTHRGAQTQIITSQTRQFNRVQLKSCLPF